MNDTELRQEISVSARETWQNSRKFESGSQERWTVLARKSSPTTREAKKAQTCADRSRNMRMFLISAFYNSRLCWLDLLVPFVTSEVAVAWFWCVTKIKWINKINKCLIITYKYMYLGTPSIKCIVGRFVTWSEFITDTLSHIKPLIKKYYFLEFDWAINLCILY